MQQTENLEQLEKKASRQSGYFSKAQAEACGFKPPAQTDFVKKSHWVELDPGIYRLADYMSQKEDNLAKWLAWSADNRGNVQGVVCSFSALKLHNIDLPSKYAQLVQIALPTMFRTQPAPGPDLDTFRCDYEADDIVKIGNYRVTSLNRTIEDLLVLYKDDTEALDLIKKAQETLVEP